MSRARRRPLAEAVVAGLVVGVVGSVFAVSFATFVFSGDLSRHLPAAIDMNLLGEAVLLAVIGCFTSIRAGIGSIGSISAAIVAAMAASVAASLPADDPRAFSTVIVAVMLTSVAAGIFLYLIGAFRLGELVRFVPYPVLGGFMAGTGWLIARGSFGVMTDAPVTVSNLLESGRPERWLPGLAFAVLLLWLVRRSGHHLVLPLALLAGVALFYAALIVGGGSISGAEANGWLVGPFPGHGGPEPWMALDQLDGPRWSAIADEAGSIATLLVVAPLALLLNANATELLTDGDGDLDRELKVAGAANVAVGLGGSISGYHSLSLSALTEKMGGAGRLSALVAAGVSGCVLLGGAPLVEAIPRAVLGGLLLFLGLIFLVEWLFAGLRKLPRRDYAIVVAILLAIATIGFLAGVAVGLAAAVAIFIVDYSRVDAVKHELSRDTYQSNYERPARQHDLLHVHGERIYVLELRGFLFFGTAKTVLDRIRARFEQDGRPAPAFVVLDFVGVTGLDSSAVVSFVKVRSFVRSAGAQLVLSAIADDLVRQLERGGLPLTDEQHVHQFADLDRGVQWCEDRLLETLPEAAAPDGPSGTGLVDWSDGVLDLAAYLPYLERIEIAAGHTLIEQGEQSTDVFFLVSGQLTAVVGLQGKLVRLRTMSPGTVVGEITMYLEGVRTASVVSDTPCSLYRLSETSLAEMERRDSQLAIELHRRLAGRLAERLADALRTVKALHE